MARLHRTRRVAAIALAIAGAAALSFGLASWVVSERIESGALRVSSSGSANPATVQIGDARTDVVQYPTDGGEFPAWWLPGTADTTIIAVHSRGADIDQTIPVLEIAQELGFSALAIRYRNDPGTLITPGRRATFGAKEWRDLEGAARFAVQRGAKNLVIVGYSMGGAIALSFLRESRLAALVSGVVLDSPTLSLDEVVDDRVERVIPGAAVRLPGAISWGAKTLASRRYDVDWDAVDFFTQPLRADVPILIFHGTKDRTVPFEQSERFAALYPQQVTLERLEGAGHVEAAAFDRARHDRSLRSFLTEAS